MQHDFWIWYPKIELWISKNVFKDILKYTDFWISKNELWNYPNIELWISKIQHDLWISKNRFMDILKYIFGPNIHWTSNYGTGIVFIENMLSWLSFHSFVWWRLNTHISIISPIIWDLFSKSNSSVYYFYDCCIIFKEDLTVFVNINKKPRYPFQLFSALLAEIHQIDGITSILLIVT